MDDINDYVLWAQGSRCKEQHNVMDDMINSRSRGLKALDAMTSSGLWMIWMTLGHELKALDVMDNLGR